MQVLDADNFDTVKNIEKNIGKDAMSTIVALIHHKIKNKMGSLAKLDQRLKNGNMDGKGCTAIVLDCVNFLLHSTTVYYFISNPIIDLYARPAKKAAKVKEERAAAKRERSEARVADEESDESEGEREISSLIACLLDSY